MPGRFECFRVSCIPDDPSSLAAYTAAEATRLEPVLQRPHIKGGLRGTYEEFGFLDALFHFQGADGSHFPSLESSLSKTGLAVKLFLKDFWPCGQKLFPLDKDILAES